MRGLRGERREGGVPAGAPARRPTPLHFPFQRPRFLYYSIGACFLRRSQYANTRRAAMCHFPANNKEGSRRGMNDTRRYSTCIEFVQFIVSRARGSDGSILCCGTRNEC